MKKCPYCAEEIQDDAVICRYCNKSLKVKENSIFKTPLIIGVSMGLLIYGYRISIHEGGANAFMGFISSFAIYGLIASIIIWLYRVIVKRNHKKVFGAETGFPSILLFSGLLVLYLALGSALVSGSIKKSNDTALLERQATAHSSRNQPTSLPIAQEFPTQPPAPSPTLISKQRPTRTPYPSPPLPSNLETWRIPPINGYSSFSMDSEDKANNYEELKIKKVIVHIDPPYHWEAYDLNYSYTQLTRDWPFSAVADYYYSKVLSRGYKLNQRIYTDKNGSGLLSFYSGDKLIYVQFLSEPGYQWVLVSYKNPEK